MDAREGNLTKDKTAFNLYKGDGTTLIPDRKGYDTVYTFNMTKSFKWTAAIPTWTDDSHIYKSYYIVKESPTVLSMIQVGLKTPNKPAEGYELNDANMYDAITGAENYKKQ